MAKVVDGLVLDDQDPTPVGPRRLVTVDGRVLALDEDTGLEGKLVSKDSLEDKDAVEVPYTPTTPADCHQSPSSMMKVIPASGTIAMGLPASPQMSSSNS